MTTANIVFGAQDMEVSFGGQEIVLNMGENTAAAIAAAEAADVARAGAQAARDAAAAHALNAQNVISAAGGTGDPAWIMVRPDGKSVQVYWKGFKDGGTDSLDPNGTPKLVIIAQDLGFNEAGEQVLRNRTIVGTVKLHDAHPNHLLPIDTEDAVGASRVFVLSEPIFAMSNLGFGNSGWLPLATMATGLYVDNGSGGSSASSGPRSIYAVNMSTLAYPKMVANWAMSAYLRVAGTLNGEVALDNQYGFDNRPYACMKLRVTDLAGDVATGPASATYSASAQVTTTNPAPLVAKASVNVSALAEGLADLDMLIYPWLGDEPWDSAQEGMTWPTPHVSTIPVLIDNSGDYVPAYAALDTAAGNDGTAAVSTTQLTAEAAPYLTWAAARAAIKTFNNARGHNDHAGGVILLKQDIAGFGESLAANITVGDTWFWVDCWSTVTPRTVGLTAASTTCNLLSARNLFIRSTSNTWSLRGADGNAPGLPVTYNRFENCKFSASAVTNGTPLLYEMGMIDKIGCLMENCGTADMRRFSVNRQHHKLHLGTIYTTTSTSNINAEIWTAVGCSSEGLAPSDPTLAAQPNIQSFDGQIHQNNLWLKMRGSAGYYGRRGRTRGFVVAQSVYELITGVVSALTISADSELDPVQNGIVRHVTVVGGRFNGFYQDSGTGFIVKEGVIQYCLGYQWNIKDDSFAPASGARLGNRFVAHGVGCFGNHWTNDATGADAGGSASVPGPLSWLGVFLGLKSTTGTAITYTDDNAAITGDSSGGGNYLPTGTVTIIQDKVAAGRACYPTDIAGTPRLNDGNGSCGAYEVG